VHERASLVPWAEWMDHDCFSPTGAVEMTHEGLSVYALRDLQAGEPLTISYGAQRTNLDLLATHGFCVENNPNDVLTFYLDPEHRFDLRLGESPLELVRYAHEIGLSRADLVERLDRSLAPQVDDESALKIAQERLDPLQARFALAYRATKQSIRRGHLEWLNRLSF
jgi:hypothetical protein